MRQKQGGRGSGQPRESVSSPGEQQGSDQPQLFRSPESVTQAWSCGPGRLWPASQQSAPAAIAWNNWIAAEHSLFQRDQHSPRRSGRGGTDGTLILKR